MAQRSMVRSPIGTPVDLGPAHGCLRAAAGDTPRGVRDPGYPGSGRVRDGASDLPVGAHQLTAQDLFTRCITGLRVTPVSTKAVDVAGILFQAIVPQAAPEDWPDEACWAYHGVPQHLVFTDGGPPLAGPR
jgi:transposase InsO family protein